MASPTRSSEVQATFRYLYARVARDEGLLELVRHETRPEGERLVCRERESGKLYVVERPASWTAAAEAESVAELRCCLLPTEPHAGPNPGRTP
jgi:hypothetical protein